jgi:hypothetical protein
MICSARRTASAVALTLASRLALVLLNITINLAHDSLSPLNARIDQVVRARASLWRPEEIVRPIHVQASKYRGHDSDHSFAAFVHRGGTRPR